MTRKRGAPVLIELIARPNGPSVGGSPASAHTESNGSARGGSPVSDPANWGAATHQRGTPIAGGTSRNDLRLPAVLIGAGVIVIVLAAIFSFQLGQKKAREGWVENNAAANPPGQSSGGTIAPPPGGVIDPLANSNAAFNGGVNRTADPAPPVPAPVAPAPEISIRDGWNYLVVATLRRAEAEEAANYLKDNGIPVQLMPYRSPGLDRGGAEANNGRWQLWVLRGVPRADYSRTQAERDALKAKIEMLGRTWKAKNRQAPTDFSGAFWQLK
ncbi:MAG TPA: hypothetical protein VEB22_02690 [Phycisphaerales bacterium]|nr:hypothetical protein [Phycisphaerales bacterium]